LLDQQLASRGSPKLLEFDLQIGECWSVARNHVRKFDCNYKTREVRVIYGKSLPYFVGPDEHGLHKYYQTLNRIGIVGMVLVLLANEWFLRSRLPVYSATQDRLWSKVVLALNAETELLIGNAFFLSIVLVPLSCLIVSLCQPKWGARASPRALKTSLPFQLGYDKVHFYFEHRIQQVGFFIWHYVLMQLAFLVGLVLPCFFIGFLRSLAQLV
jgi:hypothetical protein